MIEAASLGVSVAWEDGGAVRGMRELQRDVQQTADGTQTKFRQMSQGVQGSLGGLGKALAGLGIGVSLALIGRQALEMGKQLVAAGSMAEEMLGKFNVVFGGQAGAVTQQLEQFGQAVGRSKFELMQMASGVQDTFVPLGFARERAAELSVSLTKLATDVASFNNASDPEVMRAFQSAIVGNHEAVRQYGIVITEATLGQELMRMGIEGGIRAATEQEKVQARLNLLYRGTSDAQGDAARTADSWANTERSLNAIIKDTQMEIGQRLLPVLTPMLADFRDIARDVGPEVVRQVGMIASGFTAMVQSLERVDLSAINGQFRQLQDVLNVSFWAEVFGFIGQQVALTATDFQQLAAELGRLGQEFDLFAQWIKGDLSFSEYRAQMIELRTEYQDVLASFGAMYDEINGRDWGEATEGLMRQREAVEALTESSTRNSEAMDALPAAWLAMTETVTPAVLGLADVWAAAWEQIQGIAAAGAEGTRAQVLQSFDALAQEYAGHAQAIVNLEAERDQYLLYLEATYQQQAAALSAAGQQADLAALTAAHQAKYNSARGYYNGRIGLEKAGQQAVYDTAKQYYVATLRTLISQLQAQVRATAAAMKALVGATVPGYMAMAQAAMAFNRAKAGAQSIGDLAAAIAEVQAAMAGIEAAGVAAADQAGASFAAWEASVGDLGGNLDAVNSSLGAMTGSGGTGSQVRPQIVDPLQEAARTAQTLASMVERAIDAFDALAEFGSPMAGWQTAMQSLLDGIVAMVLAWGQAVSEIHAAGLIERSGELTTAAKMVVDVATAWGKAMDVLDGMTAPAASKSAVAAVQGGIVALMRAMGGAVNTLEGELGGADGLARLQTAAERITAAMAPWKAASDAVTAIAATAGVNVMVASERLIWMAHGLVKWVDWLMDYLPEGVLRQTAARADQVVKALAPWKAAGDAITAIAGVAGTRVEAASERLIWMAYGLVRWVQWLENYLPTGVLEEAAARADEVVKALAPWKAAADAVTAIAGVAGTRVEAASERLIWMAYGLVRWVQWLENYLPTGVLEETAARADEVVRALAPWKAAADAVKAINDAGGAGAISHSGAGQRMMWLVYDLVRWVDWVIDYLPVGMLEEAAARADDVVRALAPWKAAADAVKAINDAGGAGVISHSGAGQRMMWLVYDLVRWVDWVIDYLPVGMLEEAAARADDVVRALAPWKAASEAVAAIERTSGVRLGNAGQRLIALIGALVADLVAMARQIGISDLEYAARVGGLIGEALAPWDKAVKFANELRMWRELPDMEERITRFARQWIEIVRQIGVAAGSLSQQGLQASAAFGEALEQVMGGLQAALDVVRDFDFQEPGPGMWANFEGWVQRVFQHFYDWVNQTGNPAFGGFGEPVPTFGGAGLTALSDWAEALQTLMGALQSALSVARDFEFEPPDATTWQSFFNWVTDTFIVFYDWVNLRTLADPGITVPRFGDAGLAAMNAWTGALGSLMGALQSALSVARDFEFEPPDATTWESFFTWVTDTFQQFATAIAAQYEDEEDLPPVGAWGDALGGLMGGLQSALALASDFEFTTPDATAWDNFFNWTTAVFEQFRAEIERRYPADDPDQFAPVVAWSNAFGALMSGLQSAISLVSEFDFEAPDPEDWDDFFEWTLTVLEDFRDAIIERYPNSTAATWEPVVAWSGALGSLMSALENAVALADEFVFIAPTALGWDNFFDWVFAVFEEFRSRIEAEYPGTPEEAAATFAPVIAFSDAISAIFQALQDGLAFFMDMAGPGAAFWEFLGGAAGNPDTSPFAQRMGYIIGAITGTMAAFEAWVLEDAPGWTSDATTLLTKVQAVIDVLQDALDLFDVAQGITFPTTGEIQEFVQAVLQLFVSFSTGLAGLVSGPTGISGSIGLIETATTDFVTDMAPVIDDWYDVGADLVDALTDGMAAQFGTPTATGTLQYTIQEIQNRVIGFATWWVPNVGEGFWYAAGDDLVDAFIAGMSSNLTNVYNAAFAIGEAAGQGLAAGAGLTGGSANGPEGLTAGMGRTAASAFGWSQATSATSSRDVTITVRFEGAPATIDRRTLDALKSALVYEIRRGA